LIFRIDRIIEILIIMLTTVHPQSQIMQNSPESAKELDLPEPSENGLQVSSEFDRINPPDPQITPFDITRARERTSASIALILSISLASVFGISLVLLSLGISFDKISATEAKDIFSLILVALVGLAGSSIGFYLGANFGARRI